MENTIKALEKLIQVKDETIKELEKQIQLLKAQNIEQPIYPILPQVPQNPWQPYYPTAPWYNPYIITNSDTIKFDPNQVYYATN